MASEVQAIFGLEIGEQELHDLVSAGDDNAWSLEDWTWDPNTFVAKPASNCLGNCRASKRHCSGLANGNPAAPFLQMLQKPCCAPDRTEKVLKHKDYIHHGADKMASNESLRLGLSDGKGAQTICQVEDCGRDLSHLSTYHQRCHICEVHIKEQQFMRAGKMQRFCQQCGRCHELPAFQGAKRSCREQLAKHNARRRRRQKKEDSDSHDARLGPCQAGEGLADALASLNSSWMNEKPVYDAADLLLPDLSQLGAGSVEAPPSVITTQGPCGASQQHADLSAFERPLSYIPVHQSQGFGAANPATSQAGLPVQSCAQVLQPEFSKPRTQATSSSLENAGACNLSLGQCSLRADPLPVQSHEQAFGLRDNANLPKLGGNWQREEGNSPEELHQEESSFQTALAMINASGSSQKAVYQSDSVVLRMSIKLFDCTPASLPPDLKAQLTGWLKCTPLGVEGYLRPGCVHLLVQATVPAQEARRIQSKGVQALVEHLRSLHHPLWENHVHLLELNQEFALVKDGRLLSVFGAPASPAPDHILLQEGHPGAPTCCPDSDQLCAEEEEQLVKPELHSIHPAAVFIEAGQPPVKIELRGRGISSSRSKLLCRSDGRYLEGGPRKPGAAFWISDCYAHNGDEVLQLTLTLDAQPAVLNFEVQTGCLLSQPMHLLVCPTPELASELTSLSDSEGLLDLTRDLGLLLSVTDPATNSICMTLASSLTEYACKRDLPEVLSSVLACYSDLQQQRQGSLLQRVCVQEGSLAALEVLLQMPSIHANSAGPRGITPLHLAAIRENAGAFARLLTSYSSSGAWLDCKTDDGLSPSDFAEMAGNTELDAVMKAQLAPCGLAQILSAPQPISLQSRPSRADHEQVKQVWEIVQGKYGSPCNSTSSKDTTSYIDIHGHCAEFDHSSDTGSKGWSSESPMDSDSESLN